MADYENLRIRRPEDEPPMRPPSSVEKPVAENEPEGGEAVFPVDFLAFGVIAAGIIDAGFVEG